MPSTGLGHPVTVTYWSRTGTLPTHDNVCLREEEPR